MLIPVWRMVRALDSDWGVDDDGGLIFCDGNCGFALASDVRNCLDEEGCGDADLLPPAENLRGDPLGLDDGMVSQVGLLLCVGRQQTKRENRSFLLA